MDSALAAHRASGFQGLERTMNTYIKTADSTQFAAVRASRAELTKLGHADKIVPATKTLRRNAYIGAIPTLRVLANGKLGYI